MRQLKAAISRLRKPRKKSAQELINNVQIASPCPVSWNSMTGDDKVRFCGSCTKNVYDISALTADAAVELIRENQGNICIQLYRRNDGTVLTEDCPKGLKRLRQAMIKKTACVVASFGWLGFAGVANAKSPAHYPKPVAKCEPTRGKVAIPMNGEAEQLGGAIAPYSVQEITNQPVKPVDQNSKTNDAESDECCPDRMMLRILAGLVAVGAMLASFKKLKGKPIWVVGISVVAFCAAMGFVWMLV